MREAIILILSFGIRDCQLPDRPYQVVLLLEYGRIVQGNAASLLYLPYRDTDQLEILGRLGIGLHLNFCVRASVPNIAKGVPEACSQD